MRQNKFKPNALIWRDKFMPIFIVFEDNRVLMKTISCHRLVLEVAHAPMGVRDFTDAFHLRPNTLPDVTSTH